MDTNCITPADSITLLKERIIKVETLLYKYADLSKKYNDLQKLQSSTLDSEKRAKRDATKCLEKFSKLLKKHNSLLTTVKSLEDALKEKENELGESQRELERVGSVIQMYKLERDECLQNKKDKEFLLSSIWKVLKDSKYKGDMVGTIFKRFERELADLKLGDFRVKQKKSAIASNECGATLHSPELQSVHSVESDFIDVDTSPAPVQSPSTEDITISSNVVNGIVMPNNVMPQVTPTDVTDWDCHNPSYASLDKLTNFMNDVRENEETEKNSNLEEKTSENRADNVTNRTEGETLEEMASWKGAGLYEDFTNESEEEICSRLESVRSDDRISNVIALEVSRSETEFVCDALVRKCYEGSSKSTSGFDDNDLSLTTKRNFLSCSQYPGKKKNLSAGVIVDDQSLNRDIGDHTSVINVGCENVGNGSNNVDRKLICLTEEKTDISVVVDASIPKETEVDTLDQKNGSGDIFLSLPAGSESEIFEKEIVNEDGTDSAMLRETKSIFDVPDGKSSLVEQKSIQSNCASDDSFCLEFSLNKDQSKASHGSSLIREGNQSGNSPTKEITDQNIGETESNHDLNVIIPSVTAEKSSDFSHGQPATVTNKLMEVQSIEALSVPELNVGIDDEIIGVLKNVSNVRLISPLREKEQRKKRQSQSRKRVKFCRRTKLFEENIQDEVEQINVSNNSEDLDRSQEALGLTDDEVGEQQLNNPVENRFGVMCSKYIKNIPTETGDEDRESPVFVLPENRPATCLNSEIIDKAEEKGLFLRNAVDSLTQTENSFLSRGCQTLDNATRVGSGECGPVAESLVRRVCNKILQRKLEPRFRVLDRLDKFLKSQSSWSDLASGFFENLGFHALKYVRRRTKVSVSFEKRKKSHGKTKRKTTMSDRRRKRKRKRSLWSVEEVEDERATKESDTNFIIAKEKDHRSASKSPVFGCFMGNESAFVGEPPSIHNPFAMSDESFNWFVAEKQAKLGAEFLKDWDMECSGDLFHKSDTQPNGFVVPVNPYDGSREPHMDLCVTSDNQVVNPPNETSSLQNAGTLRDSEKVTHERVSCKHISVLTGDKSESKMSDEEPTKSSQEIVTKLRASNVVRRSARIQNRCKRLKLDDSSHQTKTTTASLEPEDESRKETSNSINCVYTGITKNVQKGSVVNGTSLTSSSDETPNMCEQIAGSDWKKEEVVRNESDMLPVETAVITGKRRVSRIGPESTRGPKTRRSELLQEKKKVTQTRQFPKGSVAKETCDNFLDSILTAMTKQTEESKPVIKPMPAEESQSQPVDTRPDLRTCLLKPYSLVPTRNEEESDNGFYVVDSPKVSQATVLVNSSVSGENDLGLANRKEGSNGSEGKKMNKLVEKVVTNFLKANFANVKEAEELLKPCLVVLQNASDDTIASVMVSEVLANVDEELQHCERPAPPLTQTQYRLVIILTVLGETVGRFESVSRQILKRIWFKLFPDRFFWPDDSIEMAVRFYSALCKKLNDFKQLWKFCFKAMTSMKQRWCIVVLIALQTWPDIMLNASQSQGNILVETFANVVLQTPQTEEMRRQRQRQKLLALKHLILNFYGFQVTKTIEGFAETLFESLRNGVPGAVNALVLLTRSRCWTWSEKCIVPKLSQSLMDWCAGTVPDEFGHKILNVIERISSAIPISSDEVSSPSVLDMITKLSQALVSKNGSPASEEKVIRTLCSLSHQRRAKDVLIPLLNKFPLEEQLHKDIKRAIAVKRKATGGKKPNISRVTKTKSKKKKNKKKVKKKPKLLKDSLTDSNMQCTEMKQ